MLSEYYTITIDRHNLFDVDAKTPVNFIKDSGEIVAGFLWPDQVVRYPSGSYLIKHRDASPTITGATARQMVAMREKRREDGSYGGYIRRQNR